MKYREVAKKLRALGCEETPRRSAGSHRTWYNPATGRMAALPDWGAKDLKIGTLRAVVRQLGVDWKDFTEA
jgi:predicted RNA binding protein YcfA (HicA-like mRNA interferase family)